MTIPAPGGTCWAMTTGEIGMVSQAVGLAHATGLDVVEKTVSLKAPWRWLPGHRCPVPLKGLGPGDRLAPPWPDLLITCGRRSTALSIAIRQQSGGRTYTVHIQNPLVPTRYFDLVVAPRHDGIEGANVLATRGAVSRVSRAKLEAAAREKASLFEHLPRPHVAVLIGGSNGCYRLTPEVMADVADKLAAMARTTGASLVVTPSRRTGAENEAILRAGLADVPAWIWDGRGDNPYFAMLGDADAVVVTCDSVSMVSEATVTGRPVYVIQLEGGNRRFERFHELMRRDGVTRPFTGALERWSYTPLDDTAEVAAVIRRELGARQARRGAAAGAKTPEGQ